jgi:hypothetical protein
MVVDVIPIYIYPKKDKTTVPFAWAPKFAPTKESEFPLNDLIISIRMKSMYRNLMHEEWCVLRSQVGNTLQRLMNDKISFVTPSIKNKLIDEMYHMLVEIALKKHQAVHDRLRDAFYMIEMQYFMQ